MLGLTLRCWALPHQILGGDEIHSIRALQRIGFPELLYTYRLSDHSIALSTFYKACLETQGKINWVHFRALPILSGALLLTLGWLALRRLAGAGVALWWLALAAFSPSLVYFSRIARPYGPALFAVSATLVSFYSWWFRKSVGPIGFVAFATIAVWFHVLTLPFVLAPFAFGLIDSSVDRLYSRPCKSRLRALALAGLGLLFGLSTFLVPGAESLAKVAETKSGAGAVSLDTFLAVSSLIAGSHNRWITACFFGLCVIGWASITQQDRRTGLYLACLLALPALAIDLLSPTGISDPKVLHRYLLPTVPILLLCIAAAASLPSHRPKSRHLSVRSLARPTAVLALLVGASATGPLLTWEFLRSNLAHHGQYLLWHSQMPQEAGVPIPDVYRAARAAGGIVLEFPWPSEWRYSLATLVYQRFHRQQIIVSTPIPELNPAGIELPSSARPTVDGIVSSGARFVAVHLDALSEEQLVRASLSKELRNYGDGYQRAAEHYRRSAAALADGLYSRLGPPSFESAGVLGWELPATPGMSITSSALPPDER